MLYTEWERIWLNIDEKKILGGKSLLLTNKSCFNILYLAMNSEFEEL